MKILFAIIIAIATIQTAFALGDRGDVILKESEEEMAKVEDRYENIFHKMAKDIRAKFENQITVQSISKWVPHTADGNAELYSLFLASIFFNKDSTIKEKIDLKDFSDEELVSWYVLSVFGGPMAEDDLGVLIFSPLPKSRDTKLSNANEALHEMFNLKLDLGGAEVEKRASDLISFFNNKMAAMALKEITDKIQYLNMDEELREAFLRRLEDHVYFYPETRSAIIVPALEYFTSFRLMMEMAKVLQIPINLKLLQLSSLGTRESEKTNAIANLLYLWNEKEQQFMAITRAKFSYHYEIITRSPVVQIEMIRTIYKQQPPEIDLLHLSGLDFEALLGGFLQHYNLEDICYSCMAAANYSFPPNAIRIINNKRYQEYNEYNIPDGIYPLLARDKYQQDPLYQIKKAADDTHHAIMAEPREGSKIFINEFTDKYLLFAHYRKLAVTNGYTSTIQSAYMPYFFDVKNNERRQQINQRIMHSVDISVRRTVLISLEEIRARALNNCAKSGVGCGDFTFKVP